MNLEDVLKPAANGLEVTNNEGGNARGATFIDADTFKDIRNNRYRLRDIDAPEVWGTHLGILAPAEVGAQELTTQTAMLANHFGFNRIKQTGEQSKDRSVVDLVNSSGQNLSDFLVEERLVGANRNTSNEVLTNRMLNNFVDNIGANTARGDVANRAREMVDASIRESDVAPTWARPAIDEESFAIAKRMYSHNEMAALSAKMEAETDPVKKQEMQNALYDIKTSSNPFQLGVEDRQSDRTIDNKAYSNITTSLSIGLENTYQALYGVADMVGEEAGWEWLENKGEAGISRSSRRVAQEGSILTSMSEIEDTGDAFTWLANNTAMSIPFMAAAISGGLLVAPLGGAAAIGATGALVVGALPSTILTTGSVWNSMPEGEKSAGLAVAAGFAVGLLDRFGFTGAPRALTAGAVQRGSMTELFSEIKREVAEELVNKGARLADVAGKKVYGQKYTMEQAIARVERASKAELVLMANRYGQFAGKKLRDLKMVKDTIRKISYATGREGLTETIQTAIEEVASVYGTSAELDPARFQEALITSAIIGGVFGSTFAMPSVAKQYNDRASILHSVDNPVKVQSDVDKYSQEDNMQARAETEAFNQREKSAGRAETNDPSHFTRTVEDNLADREYLADNVPTGTNDGWMKAAAERGRASRKAEGIVKRAAGILIHRPGSLWKPMLQLMIDKIGITTKEGMRRLRLSRFASDFGGLNINSGPSHQEYIMTLRGKLTSIVPDPEAVAQILGTNVRNANKIMRDAVENYARKGRTYDGPKAAEVNQLLAEYKRKQGILKQAYIDANMMEEANYLSDNGLDLLTSRQVDQRRIKNDREGFIAAMQKLNPTRGNSVAMTRDIAESYMARLLSKESADAAAIELNKNYDLTKGRLSEFMTHNIMGAYRNGIGNAAKKAGDRKYLGENNRFVEADIKKMVDEGEISLEEGDQLAVDFLDYLEIANGDYGAWNSPWVKTVQDNLILVTFLRNMGFSALASWPEVALTQLGVPQHIAFKYMSEHAGEGARSFAEYLNYMVSLPPGSPIPRKIYGKDQVKGQTVRDRLTELGYSGSQASAARQYGIEIDTWQQTIAENYAKIVGLNNITDYTRGVRASMSSDVIQHYANILATDPGMETNMSREAYTELRDLGVDVAFLMGIHEKWARDPTYSLDKKEMEMFKGLLDIGALRFVDQAMVNPLPGRVPKGFKQQKLAAFNQFQGYIANFTANILPRILRKAKSGSPGMATNAAVTAITMMAAAMFATMLRDEIKYGGPTPYLEDYDKFRRVVFASGLLGTGERILTGFSPLYGTSPLLPTSGNGIAAGINRSIEGVAGEAAAYGTVKDAVNSAYQFSFGDNEKGFKDAFKLLPVIGSVNQVKQNLADKIYD